MAKKKKYYAIKEGNGVKDHIVTTWEECKKLVHGYDAVYKSFKTMDEANEYLKIVDVDKVKKQTSKGIELKKEKKKNTRSLSFRIPKELYEDFDKKCVDMNMSKEEIIVSMIKEWVID